MTTKANILVVDDEVQISEMISAALLAHGYAVSLAYDGAQGVKRAWAEKFDLIIMDIQMPGMDGFQAVAAIRERESAGGSRVPILALTAHAINGYRERCLTAGMDGYLSKPVRPDELYAAIDRLTTVESP